MTDISSSQAEKSVSFDT